MSSTIGKELSAGSLSDTDATALTSALTSIDTSLSADGASATTSGSTSKLDPSSMKDRIDGLISDQVSAGTLTDDQASELKNLFATGGQSVGSVTSDAAAPPPGPPPDGSDTDASSNGDASGTSSGGSSVSDLFSSFLKQLQATQTSSSAYGATGTSRNTYASSALLLDTNA
ncbi:hypothetical protein MKK70_14025 [Methylobacterium sp. E-041]|uniref:hypothetical protein n=1 Tax=Methylobacterium sp. E-041 TaxID=2836573 RepID=UPI001FBB91F7|nr:hypothetical protein [Methylobacterium sp. E-041]MCJ2106476.1 hypothetical protein [Methylobacterium sp. E-041]